MPEPISPIDPHEQAAWDAEKDEYEEEKMRRTGYGPTWGTWEGRCEYLQGFWDDFKEKHPEYKLPGWEKMREQKRLEQTVSKSLSAPIPAFAPQASSPAPQAAVDDEWVCARCSFLNGLCSWRRPTGACEMCGLDRGIQEGLDRGIQEATSRSLEQIPAAAPPQQVAAPPPAGPAAPASPPPPAPVKFLFYSAAPGSQISCVKFLFRV